MWVSELWACLVLQAGGKAKVKPQFVVGAHSAGRNHSDVREKVAWALGFGSWTVHQISGFDGFWGFEALFLVEGRWKTNLH